MRQYWPYYNSLFSGYGQKKLPEVMDVVVSTDWSVSERYTYTERDRERERNSGNKGLTCYTN